MFCSQCVIRGLGGFQNNRLFPKNIIKYWCTFCEEEFEFMWTNQVEFCPIYLYQVGKRNAKEKYHSLKYSVLNKFRVTHFTSQFSVLFFLTQSSDCIVLRSHGYRLICNNCIVRSTVLEIFPRNFNTLKQNCKFISPVQVRDRLCGLGVRVSDYRYRGLGFDSRRYQIF